MDAEGAVTQVTNVLHAPGAPKWSPDGKSLAFTMFVPKETTWHIDLPAAPPGAQWTKAPRIVDNLLYRADRTGYLDPGYTHLFVVPATGGTPRQVTKGDWNAGPRGIAGGGSFDWMPDGRFIITSGNDSPDAERQYQRSNLYAIDVAFGTKRRITAQDGNWGGPRVSPDGKVIAFTGYPALEPVSYKAGDVYTIAPDGGGMTVRTPGLDRDISGVTWSQDGTGLYFTVQDKGTSNLWYEPLGSAAKQVTTGDHVLSGVEVAKNGVAFAVRSSYQAPPDLVRFDLRKPSAGFTQLTDVNADILTGVRLGPVEEIWYTSTGGAKVEGWVVKPPSFVPGRKYPLILEIHGGPHGNYNTAFNFQFQNFAANGFVVLYTNPRGSTSYGSQFGNAIFHAYPSVDYDDLMAGVDTVIGRGYVDTQHMYVGGCSGGGVLSSWVIGHTDRFAAAAVRCPVIDWLAFAGETDIPTFTYNFFAKPFWEDPKPWLDHSSIMYVGNVKTPTMLMTGVLDMRTPMPQTEEFYSALKMRGIPAVLLRFENEWHGTGSRPSNWMRTQLYMMSWYRKWPAGTAAAAGGEGAQR